MNNGLQKSSAVCSICNHGQPNAKLRSCGHSTTCMSCTSNLMAKGLPCPQCSEPIMSYGISLEYMLEQVRSQGMFREAKRQAKRQAKVSIPLEIYMPFTLTHRFAAATAAARKRSQGRRQGRQGSIGRRARFLEFARYNCGGQQNHGSG